MNLSAMKKKSMRFLAVDILDKVSANNAFAGPILDEQLDKNDLSGTADGRLLTHLVYGVLRHQGHLDWILTKFYRGNWEEATASIKNILRVGLFQLKFSDRLPAFAVVNEAVKVAKILNPPQSGIVNAVLRNYLRQGSKITFPCPEKNPAAYIAAFHSHPLWLVKAWAGLFGLHNTRAICAADNELPPLTLRANTLKISRNELGMNLAAAGFDSSPANFSPAGLIMKNAAYPLQKTSFFQEGYLRLQDEASQLISYLVNPQSRESVLDVCAGTGGKATHLAALLENSGKILAIDHDLRKLKELNKDARRQGVTIIETRQGDVTKKLPESLTANFDHVLVDAPCSGLGTLRRNPEIKWRITAAHLAEFARTQNIILQNASFAVRKGGRLIYCTCSLMPQENEEIADSFLKSNPHFSACPPSEAIPRQFIEQGLFRTYPHRDNMDGFFAAVFKRN